MKIKTSVSIDEKILETVKKIAKEDDRSVSYVLEKFIEERAQELPDPQPIKPKRRPVNYRKRPGGKKK